MRAKALRRIHALPSALLIAVGLQQLFLFETDALSPWSGGGFGMFSSIDAGAARHLHAYQIRPGLHREIQLPVSLHDEARRMLTLPSRPRMRAIAQAIAKVSTPDDGAPDSVLLQVWHTTYDRETLIPTGQILRELELPLEHD